MDRSSHEERIISDLRTGLHALPIPEPGADFDTRVLAALACRPQPFSFAWRQTCACFTAMAISCLCALGLLSLIQGAPSGSHLPASPRASLSAPAMSMASVDQVLERRNLSAGTAAQWM